MHRRKRRESDRSRDRDRELPFGTRLCRREPPGSGSPSLNQIHCGSGAPFSCPFKTSEQNKPQPTIKAAIQKLRINHSSKRKAAARTALSCESVQFHLFPKTSYSESFIISGGHHRMQTPPPVGFQTVFLRSNDISGQAIHHGNPRVCRTDSALAGDRAEASFSRCNHDRRTPRLGPSG